MCIGDESIFDYISTPTHDQNIFIKITPHAFLKSFYIFHIKGQINDSRCKNSACLLTIFLPSYSIFLFDPRKNCIVLSNFKLVQNSFYIFSRLNKRFFHILYLTFRHFYPFLLFHFDPRKNYRPREFEISCSESDTTRILSKITPFKDSTYFFPTIFLFDSRKNCIVLANFKVDTS